MKNCSPPDIVISAMGVTSAIGQGKSRFLASLLEGAHRFDVLRRPGRQNQSQHESERGSRQASQHESPRGSQHEVRPGSRTGSAFLGAEIGTLSLPQDVPAHALRTASFSAQVALVTLAEAWHEARLESVDPSRIGLIVGGSNFQQREIARVHQEYADRPGYVRPTYGIGFMDSDVCGVCTERFPIAGFAYTVGGASASGQLAVIQAVHAVRSGQVDVCIALGALMDLSHWECQSLRSLGAMGSDRFANEPALACRPFDRESDGFIFGEGCGAVVVEAESTATARGVAPQAVVSGMACVMDRNRNPNPSEAGEIAALQQALRMAGCTAAGIDYVNPHGTGSALGDATELAALKASGLGHVRINATKSVTGHGLSAAGCVELVATVLQMTAGCLHPTRNLDEPIDSHWNWVRARAESHRIEHALSISLGFGGINTVVGLRRYN